MNKSVRKILISVGLLAFSLVTIFCLWTAWENWTGAREWESIRERLVDAGIPLEIKELIPDSPKPEENFFTTPMLHSLFEFEGDTSEGLSEESIELSYKYPEMRERLLEMVLPKEPGRSAHPSWALGHQADLRAVEKELKIDSLLAWMQPHESKLRTINEAAKRPQSVIPISYGNTFPEMVSMPLPYLSDLRNFQEFQMMRACAALEAGDVDLAFETLCSMMALTNGLYSKSTLLGFLVGNISLDHCLSVIWEGMKFQQWREGDLVWIQTELGKLDPLASFESAITLEMVAFQIGAAEYLKEVSLSDSRELVKSLNSDGGSSPLGILAVATPDGVWDHNKAVGCRVIFESVILPIRKREYPSDDAITKEFAQRTHRNFLAAISVPSFSRISEKAYYYEAAVKLGIVAAALERWQLQHSSYPDSLRSLSPAFLPKVPLDLLSPTGETIRYEAKPGPTRYRIYSVGLNGSDDAGQVVTEGNARADESKGDVVWSYPPPEK